MSGPVPADMAVTPDAPTAEATPAEATPAILERRAADLATLASETWDVVIVGGGIV